MTDRPDELSFTSPGPPAASPGPEGRTTEVGSPVVPGRTAALAGGAATDPTPYGNRWGAPGGPTPAERAAARRSARRWVVGVLLIIVLVVGLAAGISAAVSRAHDRAWAPVAAEVEEPATVNAVQLVLGSCVAEVPTTDVVTTVEVVPCSDPHRAQVVGGVDAAPDAVWPGDEAAGRRAARTCSAALLGPTGRETAGDGLAFVVWTPTEDAWAQGDRTGLCLAVDDEARTGSLLE